MFCPKCGTQLKDDAAFCPKCGTPNTPTGENINTDTYANANTYTENEPPAQETANAESTIFISPDEKQEAVLGGGYLSNYISSGNLKSEYCVVSDKRVYYKGKCYGANGQALSNMKTESIVDLKDITSSGFTQKKNLIWFIFGVLCLASALVSFIPMAFEEADTGYYISISLFLGIIFLLIYNFSQTKVFQITFAGGSIVFRANKYSYSKIQEFQRELHIAIDKRNEEIYRSVGKE